MAPNNAQLQSIGLNTDPSESFTTFVGRLVDEEGSVDCEEQRDVYSAAGLKRKKEISKTVAVEVDGCSTLTTLLRVLIMVVTWLHIPGLGGEQLQAFSTKMTNTLKSGASKYSKRMAERCEEGESSETIHEVDDEDLIAAYILHTQATFFQALGPFMCKKGVKEDALVAVLLAKTPTKAEKVRPKATGKKRAAKKDLEKEGKELLVALRSLGVHARRENGYAVLKEITFDKIKGSKYIAFRQLGTKKEYGVDLLYVPPTGKRAFLPDYKLEALYAAFSGPTQDVLECSAKNITFRAKVEVPLLVIANCYKVGNGDTAWGIQAKLELSMRSFGQLLDLYQKQKNQSLSWWRKSGAS